jgi:hypothetical protein
MFFSFTAKASSHLGFASSRMLALRNPVSSNSALHSCVVGDGLRGISGAIDEANDEERLDGEGNQDA